MKSRHTTRLPDYDYSTPGAYFLTICVENRKCVLSPIVGIGVLDGLQILEQRTVRENNEFQKKKRGDRDSSSDTVSDDAPPIGIFSNFSHVFLK